MNNYKNILQAIFITTSAFIANSLYGVLTATFLVLLLLAFLLYKSFINKKKMKISLLLTKSNKSNKKLELVLERSLVYSSLTNIPLVAIIFLLLFTQFLIIKTNVSLGAIAEGMPIAKELAAGLLHPNWDLLGDAVIIYARQTVEVALLGTIIAFFISLPISFFCSWNVMNKNINVIIICVSVISIPLSSC